MISLLLISTTVFFYRVFSYFIFTMDQEYISFLAKSLTENFHIQWIGVNAADLNFYLGPFFNYFTYFWFLISNNDPKILAIVASTIGIVTVLVNYLVMKKIFNKKIAWLSSLLLTTASAYVYYQRIYWNPVLVPLMSLLFYYLLHINHKRFWPIPYLFLLGLSFHIHLSLLIFSIPFVYFFFREKLFLKIEFYLGVLMFVMVNIPLIVFDYIKNLENLKALLKIIGLFGNQTKNVDLSINYVDKITVIGQSLFFGHSTLVTLLGFMLLALIIWKFWHILRFRKELSKESLAVLIVFLYFVSFLMFPHKTPFYYLLGALPFLYLIISLGSQKLLKNKFWYLAILAWVIINGFLFIKRAEQNRPRMYASKMKIVNYVVDKAKGKPYILTVDNYHNFTGVRYLLEEYSYPPVSSNIDNIYGWIYYLYLPKNENNKAQEIVLKRNLFVD